MTIRNPMRLAAGVATAGLAVIALSGFVPSAEKELAALYPPILRGDLSACSGAAQKPPTTVAADLTPASFGQRLNGTWELRTRTAHGITVSSSSRMARLYFDMRVASEPGLTGAALLLDRQRAGHPLALPPDSVAAYWTVAVGGGQKGRVSLRMVGEKVGSHAYAHIRNIEDSRFFALKNVYVAIDAALPSAPAWDKIVLTPQSMTYVSCELGVVERYTKVSGQKPAIEGLAVDAFWNTVRDSRRVAALGGDARGAITGKAVR